VINVNLIGTFVALQRAAKNMIKHNIRGSIVNMSSINAVVAIPTIAAYSASKGGVMQLTKASSLALVDHGIRVNAVGPGSIDTEMMAGVNANPAFVQSFTGLVSDFDTDEERIFTEGQQLLSDLIRKDDWLPEQFALPSKERYQQYLLHCDPLERFSVASFIWGPGQTTPVFCEIAAGPFCAMLLADMGADVIKVERPAGDAMRMWPPVTDGFSENFASVNRNKRSIVLDLKSAEGVAAARDLILDSDVVIENFRPGVMTRLGIDYATMSAEKPQLIYCSISAFGQTGPRATQGGFDLTMQAMAAVMSVTGEPGGAPVKCGVPLCDFVSALYGSFGISSALVERQTTNKGQHIDVGAKNLKPMNDSPHPCCAQRIRPCSRKFWKLYLPMNLQSTG